MMEQIMINVFVFIMCVCACGILWKVMPYFRGLAENENLAWIINAANVAVKAIEQTDGDRPGTEKKALAMFFLTELVESHKLKISPEQIDKIIESVVYAINNPEV